MRLQNSVIILLAYPALSQACWFFGDARNGLNTVGHAIGRVVGVIGHVPQKWDKIDWSKLQHDAQADADKIKSTFSRWGSWAEEQLDGLKKDVQHDVQQGYEVYQDFFQRKPSNNSSKNITLTRPCLKISHKHLRCETISIMPFNMGFLFLTVSSCGCCTSKPPILWIPFH